MGIYKDNLIERLQAIIVMEQIKKILNGETNTSEDEVYAEEKRLSSANKASITRDVKEFMEAKEEQIKKATKQLSDIEPEHDQGVTPGKYDVVFHRSDDHFGDIVKDEKGNTIYDTEIAKERVQEYFEKAFEYLEDKEFENAYLLLGGDIVTNEAIYSSQPHEIDNTIDEQIDEATTVYMQVIENLSKKFDHVNVVCQGGNHGEFRVKGSSKHANADDLMYNEIHNIVKWSDMENVSFKMSDRSDYVNFRIRGKYQGHLRHGDNVNNHIGTSSPESTWRAFLNKYEFDIAYRGHYHEKKMEDVQGRPVLEAPSQKPSSDFEGANGLFSRPQGYIHLVSDETPLEEIKIINYDEPKS